MDKTILATYFNGKFYTYDWLDNEEEVDEWIEINKDRYTNIEIIEISVKRVIYEE